MSACKGVHDAAQGKVGDQGLDGCRLLRQQQSTMLLHLCRKCSWTCPSARSSARFTTATCKRSVLGNKFQDVLEMNNFADE